MEQVIQLFILIPLAGFVLSLFLPAKKEGLISGTAFITCGVQLLAFLVFGVFWLIKGHPMLNLKDIMIFRSGDDEFYLDFCFDKITAAYCAVGSFLTFLVTVYCRYYMHRESGYKRFFNEILFFFLGYNLVIFSGNLVTLAIGWEVVGIASFLLISFYRERYLPVKNAVKVFSIYRIGDVGLLLVIWMTHHLWHENITFFKLQNQELVHAHLQSHSLTGVFIALMLLITASAKSAQLPFSSWLPRAMEGPTPSSAIFYGSLSVHLGVFILLRTFPLWENQFWIRVLIGVVGLSTSMLTSRIARVQSSVKAQIAFSSIAQIGLMFIEVALGWVNIALFHFAANAFLRTYQLLVSPSVVSYLIREQFYRFSPRENTFHRLIPKKLSYSVYILSIKEWELGAFLRRVYWNPLKWIGNQLTFMTVKSTLWFFVPTFILGLFCLFNQEIIPHYVLKYLPFLFSLFGLVKVLRSFTERKNTLLSWYLLVKNHFWIALAIAFNEHFSYDQIMMYLSGVVFFGVLGFWCLQKLKKGEHNISMSKFRGHAYEHPRLSFVFLISCLGLSGFPISPTFIGIDLVFGHIHQNQLLLAFCAALSFVLAGLSAVRIYARIFLGPHVKKYHEIAYRSS